MNSIKNILKVVFLFLILISALLFWQVVRSSPGHSEREITFTQFMADVDAGRVANVDITGTEIRGHYREGGLGFHLTGPINPGMYLDSLRNKGVEIRFHDAGNVSVPMQLLGTWAPLFVLAALWFFILRAILKRQKPPAPSNPNAPINPV